MEVDGLQEPAAEPARGRPAEAEMDVFYRRLGRSNRRRVVREDADIFVDFNLVAKVLKTKVKVYKTIGTGAVKSASGAAFVMVYGSGVVYVSERAKRARRSGCPTAARAKSGRACRC
jgi:hypothetical protein